MSDYSRDINNLSRGATREQAVAAGSSSDPFIGFSGEEDVRTFYQQPGRPANISETVTQPDAWYSSDLAEVFEGFSDQDKALLAIDMFTVGVYDDINDMFDENNNLNENYFTRSVQYAVGLAAGQAEFGLGSDFLDVLLRNGDSSPEELNAVLQQAKEEAKGQGGGGGRVINYIDPFALADAAKKASASVTGRMATPAEQQAFVKMVHGLQASGVSGISVGARAEAFAREQRPNEAGAMDYANAAGSLMQVLGIGGR